MGSPFFNLLIIKGVFVTFFAHLFSHLKSWFE